MKAVPVALIAVLLSGCSSAVDRAERQHEIAMREASSDADKCRIERTLADAYLQASDAEKYRRQKLTADIMCFSVEARRAAEESVHRYR